MNLTKTATKSHFIAGFILVLLSIISLILKITFEIKYLEIAIFFFGVWGGVEIGRYLEFRISNKDSDE